MTFDEFDALVKSRGEVVARLMVDEIEDEPYRVLDKYPQFVHLIPFERMATSTVQIVYDAVPDLFSKYDFRKLVINQQVRLAENNAELIAIIEFEDIQSYQISSLLINQTKHAHLLPLDRIETSTWVWMLCNYPHLVQYCNLKNLCKEDIVVILGEQPQLRETFQPYMKNEHT